MRLNTCPFCGQVTADDSRANERHLIVECRGACDACRVPTPERHETVRLFQPAPTQMAGQLAMTDQLAVRAETNEHGYASADRDETIKAIRTALKRRSGKPWSVTGGRGTAWGWITITAPPKRREGFGYMTEADCAELATLLGLERPAHRQGVDIPAGNDYRTEYINRAEGRAPSVHGTPYWD